METLTNHRHNLIALAVATALAYAGVLLADYSNGAGMALLVLVWLPAGIALVTLLAYLLLRRFLPRVAWVVTALGVVTLLVLAVSAASS